MKNYFIAFINEDATFLKETVVSFQVEGTTAQWRMYPAEINLGPDRQELKERVRITSQDVFIGGEAGIPSVEDTPFSMGFVRWKGVWEHQVEVGPQLVELVELEELTELLLIMNYEQGFAFAQKDHQELVREEDGKTFEAWRIY